ncbi:MAG: M1 family metallopeptidase [Pyrinomonadaceae bacterium]|jgi:hypothetical protein|nr:hypothetical protein [Blastocatellia bacterium]MDQ3220456.1 hypothetical protein [Acidobacteriota bacterium]MDQ3489460.1 hypothetical protein [Acidobacteriota bacterium]
MLKTSHAFAALILCFFSAGFAFSQDDKKVLGEVTVYADDPVYKLLRGVSASANAFSGDFATVNNLVMIKDAAVFTFTSGEIYFLPPVEGKITGAVFIGKGEFHLKPPIEREQKHLAIFTESPEIRDNFDSLPMFFTDVTLQQIKNSTNARMGTNGPQSSKAQALFKEKEKLMRERFRYNVTSRILSDIYAPQRKGFFTAFIDGNKFGKLLYGIDPLGHSEVYPEQVELINYGDTNGGIWTAFHMTGEYKKGTATSWQDRRTYDIKNHKIDVSIEGTRLVATDEITIEMREPNSRFLPFDLFRAMRVKTVKNESGEGLVFIQEKKEADSDFGVILPAANEVGKPFKIIVEYEGMEALRDAGNSNFILIPRSTWYPNNPNTSFGDRATFDTTFRYPKKYVLIGVGSRVGEETLEGDQKVSKWSSGEVELAVAGFNYGDFKMKSVQDKSTALDLEVFVNRTVPKEITAIQNDIESAESQGLSTGTTLGAISTTQMADSVLVEAQNSTRIYSAYFGKLPYKRLAMTQQPAAFFGQAWPTLVYLPYPAFISETQRRQLFGTRGGSSQFWREVTPHEVAHQWWGHILGWTSYHDQWMSEGFSEFSTSLYVQFIKKDTPKFIEYWDAQRRQIVEATPATKGRKPFTVGPVTQGYRLNSAKTGNIAQNMIYPKGAFILHMLRMMMFDHQQGVGDARFQKMMKEFVVSHYNKDISTNDFKLAVEKHITPLMDIDKNGKMDWFFDQWVYGTEMPSYKFTYSIGKKDGRAVITGKITQTGVSDNFVMIVPIYVDMGQGWSYLGATTIVGNTSADLGEIMLSGEPKKAAIAALQDVLAEKIEINKQ